MNKQGPIIYVEDDDDDIEFFNEAIEALGIENEVYIYKNGKEALENLSKLKEKPFIIISDVNMPVMNGFQLREHMQHEAELKLRSVPFIFFTTGGRDYNRMNAYVDAVQGYFLKPANHDELIKKLKTIISYWMECN